MERVEISEEESKYFTADAYEVIELNPDDPSSPIIDIWTRKRILKEYFPYWKTRMISVGKENEITEQNCINDWIIINWASPITMH